MTRAKAWLVVLLVALGAVATVRGGDAAVYGPFCAQPQPIVGFGTQAQFSVHYGVFIPAFEARCAKAAGYISYYSGSDATTYARALNRGPTNDDHDLFWALDRPLSAAEKNLIELDTSRFRGSYSPVGQFPLYVLGLAVAYNIDCQTQPVKFSGSNLSLIYLGQITRWNDARLVGDNPGLAGCDRAIKLTGRADASGATTTFKTYLSKWNPVWIPYAQPELNTIWPATLVCRGGGDAGEVGCVASQPGSIGYVDINLAKEKRVPVGMLQRPRIDASNASRSLDFAAPSLAGCTQAAASVVFPPAFDVYSDWSPISLVNAPDGYPMCYFSFMLALRLLIDGYSQQVSLGQAQALRDYMTTIFSAAVQSQLAGRGYGLLPASLLEMDRRGVARLEHPQCPLPVQPPSPVHEGDGCFTLTRS